MARTKGSVRSTEARARVKKQASMERPREQCVEVSLEARAEKRRRAREEERSKDLPLILVTGARALMLTRVGPARRRMRRPNVVPRRIHVHGVRHSRPGGEARATLQKPQTTQSNKKQASRVLAT